jgi:hypothetical protein
VSHAELAAIYADDQADRADWRHADMAAVFQRDTVRRARVAELLDGGAAQSADDYFHAAMVYQHGPDIADIERAHALAREAVAHDPTHPKARWLVAASEDRLLMQHGKPQRWGTQFVPDDDGHYSLYPVDGSVTDEERARWNVPSLAEARRREAELNGE